MKRRGRVILKFNNNKLRYQAMANSKKLLKKKNELKELNFEESLYLSDSVYLESEFFLQMPVKKCQKNLSLMVFQKRLNVRLTNKGPIFKIFH